METYTMKLPVHTFCADVNPRGVLEVWNYWWISCTMCLSTGWDAVISKCFHFAKIQFTVDCGISSRKEILLQEWHPMRIPCSNSLSSLEHNILSQIFGKAECTPWYMHTWFFSTSGSGTFVHKVVKADALVAVGQQMLKWKTRICKVFLQNCLSWKWNMCRDVCLAMPDSKKQDITSWNDAEIHRSVVAIFNKHHSSEEKWQWSFGASPKFLAFLRELMQLS